MNIPDRILKPEERIMFGLRALYGSYGYTPYKMQKFESYDLYAGNKDFLSSEQIIAFSDTDGTLLALKPDVTLSIVRSGRDEPGTVQKVYYQENVYRPARQGQGFREIMQTGVECIGAVDEYCLAEVLLLAAESLREISPKAVLHLSHMGLVRRLIAQAGLSGELELRAVSALAARSVHELSALCREAGCTQEAEKALCKLIDIPITPREGLKALEELPCAEEAACLHRVTDALRDTPAYEMLALDMSTVNDLGYYNGLVFRGYIDGVPERVIAGGQYDPLMKKLGRRGGAIGFAVYLDALERLQEGADRVDADALLLYPESIAPAKVLEAVRKLNAECQSVCAQKAVPGRQCFGQVLTLTESEVKGDV